MQKRLAHLIVLLSVFILAACGQSGQAGPGVTPDITPTATNTPMPKPVNVYVGTSGNQSTPGTVIALSGTTGQPLWNHQAGPFTSTVEALDHGVAYVGADTSVFALSMQDGKLLWSYPTPNQASVLGVSNGLVYGMTLLDNPALYGLDASTGKAAWTYQTPDQVDQAVFSDGVIYAIISQPNCHCSNPPTTMLALNASNGSMKWQTPPFTDHFSIQQVANGLIYGAHSTVEGPTNDLQVRRASDGSVAWQFPKEPASVTLVGMDGSDVFVLSNDGDFSNFPNPGPNFAYALSATTGATLWRTPLNNNTELFGMVQQGVVYLGSSDGVSLLALGATDGKQLWTAALGSPRTASHGLFPSTVANGLIYVSYTDGFAAFTASTGAVAWKAPLTAGYLYIVAVERGVVYGATTQTDTNLSGKNAVVALKGSDGSSLWSYELPTLFSTPAVG